MNKYASTYLLELTCGLKEKTAVEPTVAGADLLIRPFVNLYKNIRDRSYLNSVGDTAAASAKGSEALGNAAWSALSFVPFVRGGSVAINAAKPAVMTAAPVAGGYFGAKSVNDYSKSPLGAFDTWSRSMHPKGDKINSVQESIDYGKKLYDTALNQNPDVSPDLAQKIKDAPVLKRVTRLMPLERVMAELNTPVQK